MFVGIQSCQQLLVLRLEDQRGDKSEQMPFKVNCLPASLEVLQTNCHVALDLDDEIDNLRIYEGYGAPDYKHCVPVPGTSSVR